MDDKDSEMLRRALARMPAPEPSAGFVDRALAKATGRTPSRGGLTHLARRWETWIGAALGGAVATAITLLLLLRPTPSTPPGITLALNETRHIDVLIDSERALENATIRIRLSGGVALDGLENEREIDWQTNLARGSNMLSLPVIARSSGAGRLVAVIEHEGRTRHVTLDLTVLDQESSRT